MHTVEGLRWNRVPLTAATATNDTWTATLTNKVFVTCADCPLHDSAYNGIFFTSDSVTIVDKGTEEAPNVLLTVKLKAAAPDGSGTIIEVNVDAMYMLFLIK